MLKNQVVFWSAESFLTDVTIFHRHVGTSCGFKVLFPLIKWWPWRLQTSFLWKDKRDFLATFHQNTNQEASNLYKTNTVNWLKHQLRSSSSNWSNLSLMHLNSRILQSNINRDSQTFCSYLHSGRTTAGFNISVNHSFRALINSSEKNWKPQLAPFQSNQAFLPRGLKKIIMKSSKWKRKRKRKERGPSRTAEYHNWETRPSEQQSYLEINILLTF